MNKPTPEQAQLIHTAVKSIITTGLALASVGIAFHEFGFLGSVSIAFAMMAMAGDSDLKMERAQRNAIDESEIAAIRIVRSALQQLIGKS